jgi:hypothetical protein
MSKIQTVLIAQKEQGSNKIKPSVAHVKAVRLLDKHATKQPSGLIRLPEVFRVLGWLYHLSKSEAKRFIKELKCLGLIEFFPFHGVKLKRGGRD